MEQKNEYLFGMHPVIEALETNKKIEKVLFRQGMDGIQFHRLLQMLQEKDVPVQFVPEERLNRFTKGRHQGVVALISQVEYVSIEQMVTDAMQKSDMPLIVLLDGVSDVRNFGAIARSAECAGASGLVVPAKGGAAINADAIKASSGALLRISTSKVPNMRTALYYLLEAGFQIVAATEKAEKTIYEVDFKKPTAIILGSEDRGISDAVLAIATEVAKIPLSGKTLSLNVSVAASVVIFEAVRQRAV
ncbi:MAG: hypothetical protein ACD_77C00346G0012 [uncultured bacterium]|nr:MAG: hypothetical protein ACD_77C00346G0012 [uncultured bacterium]